jgi:NSS family neurotransmitter:Na+ symporter
MERSHWSSRLSFILVAVGSAVGLGNIWKFPYIAGLNGGGLFVLIYLLCIALIGLPIFVAELYIGQRSQTNVVNAFSVIEEKKSKWAIAGWFGLISAFLILSFYSVVGGWIIDYLYKSVTFAFDGKTDEQIKGLMVGLFSDPSKQIALHFVFMFMTFGIVIGGISKGIEKWSNILMPAFFVILFGLLIYSFFTPGFKNAFNFLFSFNSSKLTASGILEAVGHSFFTLSLGMGAIITYGSYLNKKESLLGTAMLIGVMDTLVALISGLIIFSIVFSYGLDPSSGPTLMFQTLPVLFAKTTGGQVVSIAFFGLVLFAALTSAISLLEVMVSYFDESLKWPRKKTTSIVCIAIFLLGILSALSTNVLSKFHVYKELTFFDFFDQLTSHYTLPLGGLVISLFLGWKTDRERVEGTLKNKLIADIIIWSCRIVAPLAILSMIVNSLVS